MPLKNIIIRADAGMAVPALYEYCEREGLGYVIGLIRNDVLERLIEQPRCRFPASAFIQP